MTLCRRGLERDVPDVDQSESATSDENPDSRQRLYLLSISRARGRCFNEPSMPHVQATDEASRPHVRLPR